jgi:hypothetical protein
MTPQSIQRAPIVRRDKEWFAAGISAEFTNGRDATLFASLKRESGEEVEITPGINHPYAVRRMVRVS